MECQFSKLPLELVLQIARYLSADSSYCLVLTTKNLFYIPDLRQFDNLETKWTEHQRRQLLPILARDWPDQTFCDYCAKLHPRRDTPKVCKDWQRWSSCPTETSGMWLHLDPWDYHLQFEDVYKVMESYRSGRDDLPSIALHTDWQVMDYKNMATLDCRKYQLTENLEGVRSLETCTNVNKGCLKKLDVVPLILDDSLIMTTTQRMFYHAEQRNDLLTNGIGRNVFRPCSHWNWTPGVPGGDYWQQCMPSVEKLVTKVLRKVLSQRSNENDHAQSGVPEMCYCCSTEYTLRVWNHGDLGTELSLETWTKLGSCRTTGEIWWLTAAQHACDIYSPDHCKTMRSRLPWKDPATGAPRFDFLLKQSSTSVLDSSFLRAFEELCSKGGFVDTSATASDKYAIRKRGWEQDMEQQPKQKHEPTKQGMVRKNLNQKVEQYQKKSDRYQKKSEQYQKEAEQTEQRHRGKGLSRWRRLLHKMKTMSR